MHWEARGGNDAGQMIMTTTTTMAMMGWAGIVVVVAVADVHFWLGARTNALLVGPLATLQCPKEQGRDDLDVKGRGGNASSVR